MKVAKIVAEKERPLTMAETEAYAQFEASDRAGHVVFHHRWRPANPPQTPGLPEGLHPVGHHVRARPVPGPG